MRKSTSIFLGLSLMAVGLVFLSSESIAGGIIGTACLFAAVILIRYADATQYTQDEKRGRCNRNRVH